MTQPHPMLFPLAANRPIGPVPDAHELVRSAREHRMSGLLWSRVSGGELSVGPELEAALAQDDLVTKGWTRQIWSVLADVVGKLSTLGVEVATFKGVTAQ